MDIPTAIFTSAIVFASASDATSHALNPLIAVSVIRSWCGYFLHPFLLFSARWLSIISTHIALPSRNPLFPESHLSWTFCGCLSNLLSFSCAIVRVAFSVLEERGLSFIWKVIYQMLCSWIKYRILGWVRSGMSDGHFHNCKIGPE